MTKKKPIQLNGYYRKNPYNPPCIHWEISERIRLASQLAQRAEVGTLRNQRRNEKESEERNRFFRFLKLKGGVDLLNEYKAYAQGGRIVGGVNND